MNDPYYHEGKDESIDKQTKDTNSEYSDAIPDKRTLRKLAEFKSQKVKEITLFLTFCSDKVGNKNLTNQSKIIEEILTKGMELAESISDEGVSKMLELAPKFNLNDVDTRSKIVKGFLKAGKHAELIKNPTFDRLHLETTLVNIDDFDMLVLLEKCEEN